MSDHLPCLLTCNSRIENEQEKFTQFRDINDETLIKMNSALNNVNWQEHNFDMHFLTPSSSNQPAIQPINFFA